MDTAALIVSCVSPLTAGALALIASRYKRGATDQEVKSGIASINTSIADVKAGVTELKHDFKDTTERLADRVTASEIKIAEIHGKLDGHAAGAAHAALLKVRGSVSKDGA